MHAIIVQAMHAVRHAWQGLGITLLIQFFPAVVIVFLSLHAGCVTLSAPTDGAVQTVHLISRQLLAVFTCDEGYAAVGETILSCVDGEWDKIPPLCACKFHYTYQLFAHNCKYNYISNLSP